MANIDELRTDLKTLMQMDEEPCVSIYMPVHRSGQEIQQDPIRMANLLREAEKKLMAMGVSASEVRELLSEANRLCKDGVFWRNQQDGLAVFISKETFKTYELPHPFDELALVAHRFHLKPLLRFADSGHEFYLLALGQRMVKLFRCTRHGIEEVELEGVPKSVEEALKYDEPEAQLRFHTIPQGASARGVPMFHGHGVGIDESKTNILRYFQQIDKGVYGRVGSETAPMVLAGLEYLLAIYREINSYPHVIEAGVSKNAEEMNIDELHERAVAVVQPIFQKEEESAASKYLRLAETELASNDVREIIPAAFFGRIESLFVPSGKHRWGRFDSGAHSILLHEEPEPGDEDLLDLAAVQSLMNGGSVYVVEPGKVPGEGPLAAIFRY